MPPQYQSQQAQNIYDTGVEINKKIEKNLNNWNIAVRDCILNAINVIEGALRNVDNVNVRGHNKLGFPPFRNRQDPRIKDLKRRLTNTVKVLCDLTDYNAAQGAQPTPQDLQGATNGRLALNQLEGDLTLTFSTTTIEADSEDDN